MYQYGLSLPENRSTDIEGYTKYSINPTWLRLNQQIHQEALQVFRKNIFVAISTPWPQVYQHVGRQGFVPLLAVDKVGERFESYYLDVQISSPTSEADMPFERFIILLDDLKTFCDFWFYQDLGYPGLNANLDLKLVLKDPYAPAWEDRTIRKVLQEKLLAPFGVIRGLQDVKIVGETYESLESAMRKAMKESVASPEACLAEGTRLKDEGNKLLKDKKYYEAIKKYEEAFFAVHVLVAGRRRSVWADAFFHTELHTGPFNRQFGHVVRIILRFKLVANIILAYLNLEQFEEAHFWGMRTINLMGHVSPTEPMDFPAVNEIGKIFYRTARACKELGYRKQAIKYYQLAIIYIPANKAHIEGAINALAQPMKI